MKPILPVILIAGGLLLIMMSSAISIPYQTLETSTEYRAYNFSKRAVCFSSNERLGFDNGSSAIVELAPNSSKLFIDFGYWDSSVNRSLIQIDIQPSGGGMMLSLLGIKHDYSVEEHYFRYSVVYGASGYQFYWTPTWHVVSPYLGFLFENPNNETMDFRTDLTSYENTVVQKEVTKYQTLLDSRYIYFGMLLVGLAAVSDISSYFREKKVRNITA
jgi:hypothetical protein